MKTGLSLLALVLALGGCTSLGQNTNTPAVVYYVLNDVAPDAIPNAAPAPAQADASKDTDALRAEARERPDARTLLVLDTTTSGFYDTDQLVYSRSADTRGQYQFARWAERPGRRFAELLRARLDHQGRYRVAAASGYVRGDLMLDTRLVEFYHDASHEPGQVRLELRADLVDMKRHTLLGRHTFEQQVPLTSYDAAGAARASSLAVSRVLDDVTGWLASFK